MTPNTPVAQLRAAAERVREQLRILEQLGETELTEQLTYTVLADFGRLDADRNRSLKKMASAMGLPTNARARVLAYLLLTAGKIVDKDELSGVAGIHEWARRLRELRLEEGWRIASHETDHSLRPGQYRLDSRERDVQLSTRWKTANRIRRLGGGSNARLLAYFRANVGKALDADELAYVAKVHAYARRIRDLVADGWHIESNLDRPALKPGQYVMVSEKRKKSPD